MMLTRNTQRKKNTKRSLLLIVLGMMSGNLTATGIGLINANNNDRIIKLSEVKKNHSISQAQCDSIKRCFCRATLYFL